MYLVMFLMLFESLINYFIGFSLLDELVTIALLILSVMKKIKHGSLKVFNKNEKRIIRLMVLISLIGIIAGFKYNYQNSYLITIEGCFFTLKSFICYFCFKYIFNDYKLNDRKEKRIVSFLETFIFFVTVLGLANYKLHLFNFFDVRFGLKTSGLFFVHPTNLAFFAISVFLIIFYYRLYKENNKKKFIFDSLLIFILLIISGRTKALSFFIFSFAFYFLIKNFKKFNPLFIIIPTFIVLFFASSSLEMYFNNTTQARGAMLATSINIAKDHTLGSGFGTFGDDLSRKHYSPLYYKYGISHIWGLSKEYSSFICDSNLPSIIAETGFIGLILFVLILYNFIKVVYDKNNKYNNFFVILCVAYLVIECIADNIFMTSRACYIFMFLCYINKLFKNEKELNSNE